MKTLYILLLLAAAVSFTIAVAASRPANSIKWGPTFWTALGLLCWVLVPLIQNIRAA